MQVKAFKDISQHYDL